MSRALIPPGEPNTPAKGPSASATYVYETTAAALNQFHAAPAPAARTHQFEPGMIQTMHYVGRLATAAWAEPLDFAARRRYRKGDIWVGRCPISGTPLGVRDEKHVQVVAGSRGGKGETFVIPNHLLWEGSLVSIDPKGENASVTAARRGQGNDVCIGMKQHVHVIDPMRVATVEDRYRATYNPLDAIDPDAEDFIEVCGQLADAIVVRPEEDKDAFWNEYARDFIEALIMFVKTASYYEGQRTLMTVYQLAVSGDPIAAESFNRHYQKEHEAGGDKRKPVSPYEGLFMLMKDHADDRCGETVQEVGAEMLDLIVSNVSNQWAGFRSSIKKNVRFMKSKGLQRCTRESTFDLSSIKRDPAGVSLYLCLPIDKMKLYNRWLRVMVTLIGRELRKDLSLPAKGRVLLFYDEFATLGYLEEIETAFSTVAGYGGKMVIVLQDPQQLEKHYPKSDRTMQSCINLKLYFNNEDTVCEQLSKRLGETDLLLEVKTLTVAGGQQDSESVSKGRSKAKTDGKTTTLGHTHGNSSGIAYNQSMASQAGEAHGLTVGTGDTTNDGHGGGSSLSVGGGRTRGYDGWPLPVLQSLFLAGHASYNYNHSAGENTHWSRGTSHSRNQSRTLTRNGSTTNTAGLTLNRTSSDQTSKSVADNTSTTETDTQTQQQGHTKSLTITLSVGQSHHKRPLIYPHDLLRELANIEDRNHPFFPGMGLARISSEWPALVHRTPYYDDLFFDGLFDRHPSYPHTNPEPLERLETLTPKQVDHPVLAKCLEPTKEWHVAVGQSVRKGDRLYTMHVRLVKPYDVLGQVSLPVHAPFSGRMHRIVDKEIIGYFLPEYAGRDWKRDFEMQFHLERRLVEDGEPPVIDHEYDDFHAGRHPIFASILEIDQAHEREQIAAAEARKRRRAEAAAAKAKAAELAAEKCKKRADRLAELKSRAAAGFDWNEIFAGVWVVCVVVAIVCGAWYAAVHKGLPANLLPKIGAIAFLGIAPFIGLLAVSSGIAELCDRFQRPRRARREYEAERLRQESDADYIPSA